MTRPARTFASLRPEPPAEALPAEGIAAAMINIARVPDGKHLAAWLMAEMRRPAHPGASADQLREAEGARRAYERLLDMMEANPTVR